MVKYPIPTGYLFTDNYSKGPLETLSIGDYGKHHNVKADFLGYSRPLNGVENTFCMPLSEKWVITVSTQHGCRMKCTFCFVPNTKILMADGSESDIANIVPGVKVISYDNGKSVVNTVVNVQHRTFSGKIYAIQLEDDTIIKVTGNHPILIKDGENTKWINAESLTADMDVITINNTHIG